jgi:hypothetical protein
MEPWELNARESIRDVVARYNANGDSGRFDQVVALFAPDAVMDVGGIVYTGHDEIRTIFTTVQAVRAGRSDPAYLHHHTASLQIDVIDPSTATARCYFEVLMAHGLDHWGRYLDEFGVVDGAWRFTRRRVVTDGATPGGWAASLPSD